MRERRRELLCIFWSVGVAATAGMGSKSAVRSPIVDGAACLDQSYCRPRTAAVGT